MYEFELLTTLFDRVGAHVETHNSELENRLFVRSERPSSLDGEDD